MSMGGLVLRQNSTPYQCVECPAGVLRRRMLEDICPFLLHALPRGLHRTRPYGFQTGPNRTA
jgi:hypothetical protein